MGPTRLYVVIGSPLRPFSEPPYPTDPRRYGLPLFNRPLSDAEFDRDLRANVKAFLDRNHAIDFAYHCNLASVQCPVYDLVGDEWVYNPDETGLVADDIN